MLMALNNQLWYKIHSVLLLNRWILNIEICFFFSTASSSDMCENNEVSSLLDRSLLTFDFVFPLIDIIKMYHINICVPTWCATLIFFQTWWQMYHINILCSSMMYHIHIFPNMMYHIHIIPNMMYHNNILCSSMMYHINTVVPTWCTTLILFQTWCTTLISVIRTWCTTLFFSRHVPH